MKFLLDATNFFTTFWDEFVLKLQRPWMWMALIFGIIGIAVTILARRIARAIRKRNDIDNTDGALITFKVVGLLFVLAAVIILIII